MMENLTADESLESYQQENMSMAISAPTEALSDAASAAIVCSRGSIPLRYSKALSRTSTEYQTSK